jgi:hypothetical protein
VDERRVSQSNRDRHLPRPFTQPSPGQVGAAGTDMVTGTFHHSPGRIGELVLESESKPIGVTPGHLIWSEDRQAWVPVRCLRRGERLQTLKGMTRVVSYTMTDRVEPVYNFEVEGSHCYRVGESGVLVHNMSGAAGGGGMPPAAPSTVPVTGDCSNLSTFSNDHSAPMMLGVSPVGHGIPTYCGGRTQGVFVANNQEARLTSGQTNPGLWLNQTGFTAQSWYHVEGHAVSIMKQCHIMRGTLYVNQKPCRSAPAACQTTLFRALPQGWVLEVVYEQDDHTTAGTGRFVGGIGWQEP